MPLHAGSAVLGHQYHACVANMGGIRGTGNHGTLTNVVLGPYFEF